MRPKVRLILCHVRAFKMLTGASSDIKRRCFTETFSYKFSRLVLRQAVCSTVFICHCASLKMWLGLPAASVVLPYHRNVNPTFINNNDGLFRIAAISWINSFTPTVCLSRSVLVFTFKWHYTWKKNFQPSCIVFFNIHPYVCVCVWHFFCEQPDFNSDFTFSNGEICTFPRPDGTEHVSDFAIVQPRRVDRPGYGQQAGLSTSFVDNAIGFWLLFSSVHPCCRYRNFFTAPYIG